MLEHIPEQIPPVGLEPILISAHSLVGRPICNLQSEKVGKVDDVGFDTLTGRISFVVLSFEGTIEPGNVLVAVPWQVVKLSLEEKAFYLDREIGFIQNAPGYNLTHLPSPSDAGWLEELYHYYGYEPYWL